MNLSVRVTDTSADALEVQLDGLRQMTPRQRIAKMCSLSRRVKNMAFEAIRRRHADLDEEGVRRLFIELTYGKSLDDVHRWKWKGDPVAELDDLIAALSPVVAAFQSLNVRHYVGGSVASSFHGASRSTMDVDLVCELTSDQIPQFLEQFGQDFYVSEPAVREAVDRKSCFNLIHLPTSFKVDVFVSRGREFDRNSMARATTQTLGEGQTVDVPIATAEDSIVSKLEWYRKTNESSDRQWDDVDRLIRLLGSTADLAYLHEAAQSVGVDDLLNRLLAED